MMRTLIVTLTGLHVDVKIHKLILPDQHYNVIGINEIKLTSSISTLICLKWMVINV